MENDTYKRTDYERGYRDGYRDGVKDLAVPMAGELGYREWDAMQEHVGKYKEAGWMLGRYVCSCGWESKVYYDGYEFAKEEWGKHVEDSNRGFENNN